MSTSTTPSSGSEEKKFPWNVETNILLKKNGVTILEKLGYGSFSVVYEAILERPTASEEQEKKSPDPVPTASTSSAVKTEVKKVPTASSTGVKSDIKKIPTEGVNKSVTKERSLMKEVSSPAKDVKSGMTPTEDFKDSSVKPGPPVVPATLSVATKDPPSITQTSKIRVAVKFIDLSKGKSEQYLQKFHPREIKASLELKHKYIIPVISIIEDKHNQFVFIVMDLAKSDLLREIEKNGIIPEAQAKSWMRNMTKGMQYLHSQNWAHRDLKVENVLIAFKDNRAMISDFGFVRQIEKTAPLSSTFCGSISYAAPEVASGQGQYDPFKADNWSLGVILYAMTSASMPFKSEDPKEIIEEMTSIQDNIDKKEVFSPPLKDLLKNILTLNPEKRASLLDILNHPYLSYYHHHPVAKRSSSDNT